MSRAAKNTLWQPEDPPQGKVDLRTQVWNRVRHEEDLPTLDFQSWLGGVGEVLADERASSWKEGSTDFSLQASVLNPPSEGNRSESPPVDFGFGVLRRSKRKAKARKTNLIIALATEGPIRKKRKVAFARHIPGADSQEVNGYKS
jgi:hypothetical protein